MIIIIALIAIEWFARGFGLKWFGIVDTWN